MPTLAFVGDIMLGRGVNAELPRKAPEEFWGSVLPVLRTADAVIGNLECAITRHTTPWTRYPKVFHFRADPAAIDLLKVANVRCVSLANNHVLDYETEGLLDTLRHLDDAGIARAGAGRDSLEAITPAVIDVGGLRVAIIAATDNEPEFAAASGRPGTCYFDIGRDLDALGRLGEVAGRARRSGAGLVVLSLHWGPNMVSVPPMEFRCFAREAQAFADIVYGHSAHVFQGIEQSGGKFILYDTGDFLDDYAVDQRLRNDWSFVFLFDVTPGGTIQGLRMRPVLLEYARVDLATGQEFQEVCSSMVRRAEVLETPLRQTAEGLELRASRSDTPEARR
jgi:poly-gamma-glutamate synthesis protein (capsule biosynthesis protein)